MSRQVNDSACPNPAKRKKTPRRMRKIVLLLLSAGMIFLFFRTEQNVTQVVLSLSQATARSLAIQALNEAASEMLGMGVEYGDLMTVSTDAQGQVRLIQANTPEMNRLAARASLLAQEKLTAMGQKTVIVPLGSAIGSTLFAGAGPGISVQILPVGSVQAAFSTDFSTAGINQTRHRISLVLTANVQIVIPTGAKNVQVSTQMAMAESIIIGQVPDSFTDVGEDMDMLDLAP